MPVFSSKYPNQTVQQLNATQTEAVGRMGRVVHLTNEDYTVDPLDDLIVLTSTSSSADWTLTFPASLPDNNRVLVAMPVGPTGTDAFVTSGLAAEATFDSAAQVASVITIDGVSMVEGASAAPTPPPSSLVIGNGTGSTTVAQSKSDAGTAAYQLKSGTTVRGDVSLTSGEAVAVNQRDGSGSVVGSLVFHATSGLATLLKGLVISLGDLTLTAGDLLMAVGSRARLNSPEAADDAAAAALSPPVPVGGQYHVADGTMKQRLV